MLKQNIEEAMFISHDFINLKQQLPRMYFAQKCAACQPLFLRAILKGLLLIC